MEEGTFQFAPLWIQSAAVLPSWASFENDTFMFMDITTEKWQAAFLCQWQAVSSICLHLQGTSGPSLVLCGLWHFNKQIWLSKHKRVLLHREWRVRLETMEELTEGNEKGRIKNGHLFINIHLYTPGWDVWECSDLLGVWWLYPTLLFYLFSRFPPALLLPAACPPSLKIYSKGSGDPPEHIMKGIQGEETKEKPSQASGTLHVQHWLQPYVPAGSVWDLRSSPMGRQRCDAGKQGRKARPKTRHCPGKDTEQALLH